MTFAELIVALDMALTGKPQKECEHTLRNQSDYHTADGAAFASDSYYLSDGGYTRIRWTSRQEWKESLVLIPTGSDESQQRMWAAWDNSPKVKALREQIEAQILSVVGE